MSYETREASWFVSIIAGMLLLFWFSMTDLSNASSAKQLLFIVGLLGLTAVSWTTRYFFVDRYAPRANDESVAEIVDTSDLTERELIRPSTWARRMAVALIILAYFMRLKRTS
jgi:hypothetical protein